MKRVLSFLFILFSLSLVLVGCGTTKYKIDFMVDNAIYSTVDTSGDETIELPQDPEKVGFIFEGWYWDNNVWQRPFTASSLLTEPITNDAKVWAKFTEEQTAFAVTFVTNGGSPVTMNDTSVVTSCPQTTKENCVFDGWYLTQDFSGDKVTFPYQVTQDTTFYAKWTEIPANMVAVSFVDGSNLIKTELVEIGSTVQAISAPNKTGYNFICWKNNGQEFDFNTPIEQTTTLVAEYQIITYQVKFYVDSNLYITKTVDFNTNLTDIPQVPAKTGYTAVWSVTSFNNITSDIEVNAVYTAKTFVVTFDYDGADGNNTTQTKSAIYNSQLGVLPQPSKNGNAFLGWYFGEVQYTETTVYLQDQNITLKAKWQNLTNDDGKSIVAGLPFTQDEQNYQFAVDQDNKKITLNANLRNAQTSFDFRNKFTVSTGATWTLFSNSSCEAAYLVSTRQITLTEGQNTYYILVENQTTYEQTIYTAEVYKNRMLTVQFYNLGTKIDDYTQTVEEGFLTQQPQNVSCGVTGYNQIGWVFNHLSGDIVNFEAPIYPTRSNSKIVNLHACYSNGQQFTQNLTTSSNTDGTLTVTGISEFEGESIIIPKVYYTKLVKNVAQNAFEGLTPTTIDIPTIGDGTEETAYLGYLFGASAYSDNSSYIPTTLKHIILEDIIFAEGAFYDCEELVSIKVKNPTGATSISTKCFKFCSNLETLDLAEKTTITGIGESGFDNCAKLSFADLDFSTVKTISKQAFYRCNITSDMNFSGVYTIKEYGFRYATIPENFVFSKVETVEKYAFYDAEIGNGLSFPLVETIGENAFEYARMDSFTFPTGLKTIKTEMFLNSKIKNITLGSDIAYIGNDAFNILVQYTREVFENVYYEGTLADWFAITFYNETANPMYYAEHFFVKDQDNWVEVTDIEIPNTVTEIKSYALYGFDSLTALTLSKLTKLNSNIINYCDNLDRIYFTGTIKEWCGITFVDETSNPMNYATEFYIKNNDSYEELTALVIDSTTTSINAYAFYNFDCLASVNFNSAEVETYSYAFAECSNLQGISNLDNVVSFGDYAFYNCTNLSGTLTTSAHICNYAFANTALQSIDITGITVLLDYAFSGCNNLTTVTIPTSLTSTGSYVFKDCTKIVDVTIPHTITDYEPLFGGCTSLENVYYTGTTTDWVNTMFGSIISTPMYEAEHLFVKNDSAQWEEVTKLTYTKEALDTHVFYGMENLTNIGISYNVKGIGSDMFGGCPKVEEISITGATTISRYAFRGATAKIYITSSAITNMGNMFNGYAGTSLTIPESITTIEYDSYTNGYYSPYPIYDCPNLKELIIPATVTNLDSNIIDSCPIERIVVEKDPNFGIAGLFSTSPKTLKEVVIKEYRTNAFAVLDGLDYIETITIPSYGNDSYTNFSMLFSSTSIEGNATSVPSTLKNVTIVAQTEIAENAFYGCANIEKITFERSLTTIGNCAFQGCINLKEIYFPGTVSSVGTTILKNCSNIEKIKIPFVGKGNANSSTYTGKPIYWFGTALSSVPSSLKTIIVTGSTSVSYITGKTPFRGMTSLEFVELLGVTTLVSSAFSGCTSLNAVVLTNTITSIESNAFLSCTNLQNVYWFGTQTQWEAVTVDATGNDPLTSATVYYYSYEQPTTEGNYWRMIDGVPTVWA